MFSEALAVPKLSARLGALAPSQLLHGRALSRWIPRRPVLGIELTGSALSLACIRFAVGRQPLMHFGSIPDYVQLTPEELGIKLRRFLEPLAGEMPTISLGLPRREVMVRFLDLPSVAKKNFAEAVALQAEMYKPTETETFDWDTAVMEEPERLATTLLFTPHPTVEKFAGLFSEAGFPLSGITATQFSLVRAFLNTNQPSGTQRSVLLDQGDSEAELALLEGSRVVYSRSFPLSADASAFQLKGQIQLAFSSLRWKETDNYVTLIARDVPEALQHELASLGSVEMLFKAVSFPGFPDGPGLQKYTGAASLALASLTPRRPYSLNLLPADLRATSNRLRQLPTYTLLAANAVLLLAILVRVPIQNYVLLRQYHKEIAGVRVRADEMKQLLQSGRSMRQELLDLDAFQRRGRQPLDALNEIAQKLPPDTWANNFSCKKGVVEVSGSAKAASPLLNLFQSSSQFQDVKFNGALSQDTSGAERFHLQLHVKEKP